MPMKTDTLPKLQCSSCGNDDLFIEVMQYVENLVDGERNHLHLLIGVPAFYQCRTCGQRIETDEQS